MKAGPQTRRVAEFARTVRWEDLPASVRYQAICCVLDLCGAAVAGSRARAAQSAVSYALHAHGTGPSTIIGTGASSTPVGAALANGFAASALDIDDGYRPVKGHPGPHFHRHQPAGDRRERGLGAGAGPQDRLRHGALRRARADPRGPGMRADLRRTGRRRLGERPLRRRRRPRVPPRIRLSASSGEQHVR